MTTEGVFKDVSKYNFSVTGVANYNLSNTTKVVEVKKATMTWPEDLVLEATYGQTLSQVELPTSENGTWSFVDSTASVGSDGEHDVLVNFTPKDNNYYAIESLVVKLNVSKLNNTVTGLNKVTVTYGDAIRFVYEASNKANATVKYYKDGELLDKEPTDVGTYQYELYIPSTDAYNEYTSEKYTLIINARQINVEITVPEDLVYGNDYEVTATIIDLPNQFVKPEITLTYTGKANDGEEYNSTTAPTTAGTYKVTATIEDSNYSLADTSKDFNIVKATVLWPEDLVLEAIYGQTLSQVVLPISENGEWSFVDPTISVGDAGKNKFEIKFVSTNPNYANVEPFEVEITVSSLEIEVEWSEDNYTYEGEELTLPTATYEGLEIVVSKVFNDVFKDAGEYAFSASVKDNNNYIIKNNEKSYKIKSREITVNIITHGGDVDSVQAAEVTFVGVIEGDDVDETITYVGTDYNSSEVPNAVGTYTVKVTINNDNYILTGTVESVFVVTEPAKPVESVSFVETLLNLEVGGSDYTLNPVINPNNATNTNVSWSVSPAGVVTVVDGVVSPFAKGEATITVTTEDGNKTATCSVKVTQPVTSVEITTTETKYTTNDLVELEVVVGPENADNKTVTWTVEPADAAEVDANGVVNPLKAGDVKITATAGSKSDSITLTFIQGLDHVVIYEVYGGGGNKGATYKNDYVVLYNPTLNDINLNGWKLNKVTTKQEESLILAGVIESKTYYVVKLAAGTSTATELPDYTIYGNVNLANDDISIKLLSGENVVDAVATGEGVAQEGTATGVLSNTSSAKRKISNGLVVDTDDNGADFEINTEIDLSYLTGNLSEKVQIKSVKFDVGSMETKYTYSRLGNTSLKLNLAIFEVTFEDDYQINITASSANVSYLEDITASGFDSKNLTNSENPQTVTFKYGDKSIDGSVDVTVTSKPLKIELPETLQLSLDESKDLSEYISIPDDMWYDSSKLFVWSIIEGASVVFEGNSITGTNEGTSTIAIKHNDVIISNSCVVTVTSGESSEPIEETVVAKYTNSTTTNMAANTNNASIIGLDSALFNVVSDKGNAGYEVGLNKDGTIRLYASSADGEGSTLTISISEKMITKIVIEFSSTVGSFVVNGQEGSKSITEYVINSESVYIKNVTTGSSTQVHIKSITISYKDKSSGSENEGGETSCAHTNTTTTNSATCTEAGLIIVTCNDCGTVISTEEAEATGHNYVDGTCSVCREKENVTPQEPKVVLEITVDDFNTKSYAANNNKKTEGDYSYTSYQVMNQQGKMQWQKSKGYITIASNEFVNLELKATGGTFTVTVGGKTVKVTTSNGVTTYDLTGLTGEVKIAVGSATGYVDYLKFYK